MFRWCFCANVLRTSLQIILHKHSNDILKCAFLLVRYLLQHSVISLHYEWVSQKRFSAFVSLWLLKISLAFLCKCQAVIEQLSNSVYILRLYFWLWCLPCALTPVSCYFCAEMKRSAVDGREFAFRSLVCFQGFDREFSETRLSDPHVFIRLPLDFTAIALCLLCLKRAGLVVPRCSHFPPYSCPYCFNWYSCFCLHIT